MRLPVPAAFPTLLRLLAALALFIFSVAGEAAADCGEHKDAEGGAEVMRVALMIDDGPSANTLRLLKVLADAGVKANFDLVGRNCEADPELVLAIRDAGHDILNHSYAHGVPANMSTEALSEDVAKGRQALKDITGEFPRFYWPPYIAIDPRHAVILDECALTMPITSTLVGASDYDMSVSAEQIRDLSISKAQDGSLILFHETRDETVDMMPAIIEGLKARGAVFLTYSEMHAYLKAKQGK